MASPPPILRAVLYRKVEPTMLTLVGLRFFIEDGHPASVRNSIPPPTGPAPNSTVLLLIVIEFPAVQKFAQ